MSSRIRVSISSNVRFSKPSRIRVSILSRNSVRIIILSVPTWISVREMPKPRLKTGN